MAQGQLLERSVFSPALNATRRVFVYLPAGYDPMDSTTRYRTVYFLHGAGTGLLPYVFFAPAILDDMIASGTIRPVILVLPDGDTPPFEGSFYTNSTLYGRFEDYIVTDVVNFVDTEYNTAASPESRFIAGHSMGGYGAMKIALKHPDRFRGVTALSGPLDLHLAPSIVPHILAENGGHAPYAFTPDAGTFTSLAFTMAGAFSPNLDNPPFLVDFPLDQNGQIVDAVLQRWLAHDPATLATSFGQPPDLDIYFDCGREDELYVFPFNTAFADTLTSHGFAFLFKPYTGGHSDQLISRVRLALVHIDSVFNATTLAVETQQQTTPETFTLHGNYPNPFNPSTTISFSLSEASHVDIGIYNLRGEEVTRLVSSRFPAGEHRVQWQAEAFPTGLYYVQMRANGHRQVTRAVLVR